MVVEIDVVPGAAGGEVGGLVALRAVDFTGARPAGQRQRFVIQVVVGHRCLQYVAVELREVGDEQPVLQPFPDFGIEVGEGRSVERVAPANAVDLLGKPSPVRVAGRLDERGILVDDHAVFDRHNPHGAGAVSGSGGGFKINGGKGHEFLLFKASIVAHSSPQIKNQSRICFSDYNLISCANLHLLHPTIRDNLGHYVSDQKKEKQGLLCGAVICSFLVPR